jgi:hypothetical protein
LDVFLGQKWAGGAETKDLRFTQVFKCGARAE